MRYNPVDENGYSTWIGMSDFDFYRYQTHLDESENMPSPTELATFYGHSMHRNMGIGYMDCAIKTLTIIRQWM
jgi:hypothetical protein